MSALDNQVGGDHYKSFVIQPVEFITTNNIGFLQGCIIKRVCRFDKPGGKGIQDLEKIKHEVDLLIELNGKRESSRITPSVIDYEWKKFQGEDA